MVVIMPQGGLVDSDKSYILETSPATFVYAGYRVRAYLFRDI